MSSARCTDIKLKVPSLGKKKKEDNFKAGSAAANPPSNKLVITLCSPGPKPAHDPNQMVNMNIFRS